MLLQRVTENPLSEPERLWHRCLQHRVQNASAEWVHEWACVQKACAHVKVKQKVKESQGGGGRLNEMQDEGVLHVTNSGNVLSAFSITGAWCIKVYAVLYVVSPCKDSHTLTHSPVTAIYIMPISSQAVTSKIGCRLCEISPYTSLLRWKKQAPLAELNW